MFTYSLPTTALFGAGKLNELHGQINTPMGAIHGKKALVVISNGKSTRANGYLDRLETNGKAEYRVNGCQCYMTCIHVCPQKPIGTAIWEISPDAPYRNRHIGLNEIILANSQ